MRRTLLIIGAMLLATVLLWRHQGLMLGARVWGEGEALVAIARGEDTIRLVGGGHPQSLAAALRARGIAVQRRGGCTAAQTEFARTQGFNEVIGVALRRKLGRDAIASAVAESVAVERERATARTHRVGPRTELGAAPDFEPRVAVSQVRYHSRAARR